jgi:toxin secretion/phage lysis holin
MDIKQTIYLVSVYLGGLMGFLYGEFSGLLTVLLVLSVFDYVTGIICALKSHTLSSAVGYVGIAKKLFIFVLVAVAHLIDVYVMHGGSALMSITLLYYISNEGISICENAGKLGVPLPKKLMSVLVQIRKENDGNDDRKENK